MKSNSTPASRLWVIPLCGHNSFPCFLFNRIISQNIKKIASTSFSGPINYFWKYKKNGSGGFFTPDRTFVLSKTKKKRMWFGEGYAWSKQNKMLSFLEKNDHSNLHCPLKLLLAYFENETDLQIRV